MKIMFTSIRFISAQSDTHQEKIRIIEKHVTKGCSQLSFLFLAMFMFLSGCNSGSASSGGSGSLEFTECQAGRTAGPVPCTADYNPVCGLRNNGTTESYANGCNACAELEVNGYWQGDCITTVCPEPRPKACTREYVPVCGQLNDGTLQTMANSCEACANDRVVSFLAGTCSAGR